MAVIRLGFGQIGPRSLDMTRACWLRLKAVVHRHLDVAKRFKRKGGDVAKIACLIMGQRGASILGPMLPVYLAAGWDIFLHIDKKADHGAFCESLGEHLARCHLVDPVEVFWGGYSMVEAELRLIQAARSAAKYDRFVFITDDTIPLFPPAWLNAILGGTQELISAVPQAVGSKNYLNYQRFWHYDHPLTTERAPPIRPTEIDDQLLASMMDICDLKKVGKKQIRVAHGYPYWALSESSVSEINDVVSNDAHFVRSFRYARQPDELMLQTIFFNLAQKGIDLSPVYMDFFSQNGGPRLINSVAGLPFDLHEHQTFVRKVRPDAHEFARLVGSRLVQGLTAWGHEPTANRLCPAFVDDSGTVQPTALLRLAAPKTDAPGWNGIETYHGRRFRWTAEPTIEWEVTNVHLPPGRLRCFIPVLMEKKGMYKDARLVLESQSKPLVHTRQSLIAEFEHNGLAAGSIVRLTTPPPVPAYPPHDNRKTGLAIAVEPF
jgi:hypothetical protein